MPHNVSIGIDHKRGRQVGRIWVREPTGFEVIDRDLDGEQLIFGERREIGREDKLGRGYVIHARDHAYWSRIT